jgi:hypothetical protein
MSTECDRTGARRRGRGLGTVLIVIALLWLMALVLFPHHPVPGKKAKIKWAKVTI